MSNMLCDRPNPNTLDYNTLRFVVSRGIGLDVMGKHLEMGDEIPKGTLSAVTLRELYEFRPGIETLEFAMTDSTLREACARRGVSLEESTPPVPQSVLPDLEKLGTRELVILCEENGLSPHGNRSQLKKRLLNFLV